MTLRVFLQLGSSCIWLFVLKETAQMDRATMLAENKERERQFNQTLAMSAAPPWPVLEYTEEPFAWKHGARTLIAERNRVGEIRVLREAMTYEKLKDSNGNYSSQFYHCDMPCSFHEAFIASDDERAFLMHNLHRLYNEQWQKSVVGMHLDSFPKTEHKSPNGAATFTRPDNSEYNILATEARFDAAVAKWAAGVAVYYKVARSSFEQHQERLLLMQALTQELQPETRQLISRCCSFEMLDRCMLAC